MRKEDIESDVDNEIKLLSQKIRKNESLSEQSNDVLEYFGDFKRDKRDGIYFFPPSFIPELQNYVKKLNPGEKHIFPEGNSYLTTKTLYKHMRKVKIALGLSCKTNPHAFLDFLNEQRIEMRITKEIRKILLNQKSKDVNITHYAKKFKNRIYLGSLYDKCNPFKKLVKPEPML